MNPAKTLALELLDALPVIAAEGPLAGAAATRVADQLATLAGLPVAGFRLPDQRVAACAVLGGPLAPGDGRTTSSATGPTTPGRRLRLLTIRDADAGEDDGAGEREPRSAGEAMDEVLRTAAAHNVPVSGLAEHGEPERFAPAAAAGPAAGGRRLQRRLPGAGAGPREGPRLMSAQTAAATEPAGADGGTAAGTGGTTAIIAALAANLGIAVAKFVAFLVTGASSMLAEAIHSVADSGNQVLLLVGGRRAERAATPEHPFGYGRDRYIYALHRRRSCCSASVACSPSTRACTSCSTPRRWSRRPGRSACCVVAIVLEGFSLRTAIKETDEVKSPRESYWAFIRTPGRPELPVVLLEDTAALHRPGVRAARRRAGRAHRQRRLRRPGHRRDRPAAGRGRRRSWRWRPRACCSASRRPRRTSARSSPRWRRRGQLSVIHMRTHAPGPGRAARRRQDRRRARRHGGERSPGPSTTPRRGSAPPCPIARVIYLEPDLRRPRPPRPASARGARA